MTKSVMLAVAAAALLLALGAPLVAAAPGQNTTGPFVNPAPYFIPSYPYNQSDITYPFKLELNTLWTNKFGANIPGMNFYHAILTLYPCVWITEHYHPEAAEFNFVISGGFKYWIALGNGTIFNGSVPQGAVSMMPMGLSHMILNDQCTDTVLYHTFPQQNPLFIFNVINLAAFSGGGFLTDTFPASGNKYPTAGLPPYSIPDGIHTVSKECIARCKRANPKFNESKIYRVLPSNAKPYPLSPTFKL